MNKIVNRVVQARLEGDGRPFIVGHLITQKCMCNCRSCLWKHNDYEDVPFEDIRKFYAQAAEEGFLATAFSGGEPFLREDLGEIVKFVKEEADMGILLFTTGWFLEERMDEVLPYIDMLVLSLDSARPEIHDDIRGLPGLFDRLMKGVDLVNEKYPDVSRQFNVCVQKGIAEEIDDLIALAEDKGLQMSFDVISEYRHGEGDTHFVETNMGLPPQELRGVCAYPAGEEAAGRSDLELRALFQVLRGRKAGLQVSSAQTGHLHA